MCGISIFTFSGDFFTQVIPTFDVILCCPEIEKLLVYLLANGYEDYYISTYCLPAWHSVFGYLRPLTIAYFQND